MKRLFFLLLFGLFLLGPPGEVYASDSDFDYGIEMVWDFEEVNLHFDFVNQTSVFASGILVFENAPPGKMSMEANFSNQTSVGLNLFLIDRDDKTEKKLYNNTYLKLAKTERLCSKMSNLYFNYDSDKINEKEEVLIRGKPAVKTV